MGYPDAEFHIDEELVQQLIDSQFPEFSGLSIRQVASGWDNQNYKLGSDYLVRIPRRKLGAELITHETEWTQKLKDKLPIPIPAPVKIGNPGNSYPWKWNILPWFEGATARNTALPEFELFKLVNFLKVLHAINPKDAPKNPFRDVALAGKVDAIEERLRKKNLSLPPSILRLWKEALSEKIDTKPALIHGDLHPGNIIVNKGNIQAIIDWGDITKGDPATDLAIFWMLPMSVTLRERLLLEYGATDSTISRAKGWTVFYAAVFLTAGIEHEKFGYSILNNMEN